jgi:hypothetical protein
VGPALSVTGGKRTVSSSKTSLFDPVPFFLSGPFYDTAETPIKPYLDRLGDIIRNGSMEHVLYALWADGSEIQFSWRKLTNQISQK